MEERLIHLNKFQKGSSLFELVPVVSIDFRKSIIEQSHPHHAHLKTPFAPIPNGSSLPVDECVWMRKELTVAL